MFAIRTISKRRLVALIVVIVLAGGLVYWHTYDRPVVPHKQAQSGGQETKGETKIDKDKLANTGKPSDYSQDKLIPQPPSHADLIEPSGNFVSNHRPNLGGQPAPNTMQSTCTSYVGASCTISFSKDGVTRALPTQMVDSNGTAYWSWTLQEIGLTVGTWKVKAQATLGNQSKSAIDPLDLVVDP